MSERRRTFLPVAGPGIASGVLAAVAGARAWFTDPELTSDPFDTVAEAGEMPLASTLGLVVLACFGVLLVTRGGLRRVVSALAALAAAGLVATVVVGYRTAPGRVADAVRETAAPHRDAVVVEATGWYWVAALAAAGCLVAAVLATMWSPSWPEMGSRYDAPGGDTAPDGDAPEDRSNLDLWKSLDEGRDPTA